MLWFFLSLFTAFFESLRDVFSKKGLGDVDEYLVTWSLFLFTSLFLIPFLFIFGVPSLSTTFWIVVIIDGSLNVIAFTSLMKAIKYADLSVVSPLMTFAPLFMLVTSPLIVNEFPRPLGLLGVLLIVIGSYTLNIKERSKGYLTPFKVLFKEKGPKYMLLTAFIWSITVNLDKIGVQHSSPFVFAIAVTTFITIAMLPFIIIYSEKPVKQFQSHHKVLFLVGFFHAIMLIFQFIAITLTLVVYVSSLKRLSVVLSVLWGYFIFKEKGVKERLLGASIMVVGVFFIALS